MMRRFIFFLILTSIGTLEVRAQNNYSIKHPGAIPLHGTWSFALDPAVIGEQEKWYQDENPLWNWDKVEVPHCFSVDPRYKYYTGLTWYRRTFSWKPVSGKRVILHFDGAYYESTIWLNNKKVGSHEGGYTPFQIDITDQVKSGDNFLTVSVNNNTWKRGTIPGIKDEFRDGKTNNQFPGWINYGGIMRPVYITIEPEVYLKNIKVETTVDLKKKTAQLRARFFIRNKDGADQATPAISVYLGDRVLSLKWKFSKGKSSFQLDGEVAIKASDLTLWSVDEPTLYRLVAILPGDTLSTSFGIRQVKVKDGQLLVNGESVRMAGANRVIDYPNLGSLEPDWLVEKDLRLMKEAGMEFSRLTHYTPSEAVLEWADRHGMLIVAEAGNWQLTPKQMDNDTIRKNFRSQFTEMVERDWNHPSVIAYSVGNEYLSTTPSGQRWTKDMIAFGKQLDTTRLYTFATMMLSSLPKNPEDEASQYCDFISANIYGNHVAILDNIHRIYPNKPVLISEYGTRADGEVGEEKQKDYLKKFLGDIRQRPYVVGASWWSFNDYESRHPGTNTDGYRWWGLVKSDRTPRPVYAMHRAEMSPVIIQKKKFTPGASGQHTLIVTISNRSDFPAYAVKRYVIKVKNVVKRIPDLLPGQSVDVTIPITGFEDAVNVEVVKPTGFSIVNSVIELK